MVRMRDCTSRGQQRQPNQEKTMSFLEKPHQRRDTLRV